jgi:hypothetical protein
MNKDKAVEKIDKSEMSDSVESFDMQTDNVPKRVKGMAEAMMLSMRSESHMISSANKIAEKLTPEHITQIIDNAEEEDKRSFSAFKMNSVLRTVYIIISLSFALFLLIFFKDSEYFSTILTAIFSFLGGIGIGKYVMPSNK